jgi:glucose dehydrogenase
MGYSNSLDGQRYSTLDQINASTVARLRPICELTLGEDWRPRVRGRGGRHEAPDPAGAESQGCGRERERL